MSEENTNEELDGTSENPDGTAENSAENPAEDAPNDAGKPAEDAPDDAESSPDDMAEAPAEHGTPGGAEDPAENPLDGLEDAAEKPLEDAPGAAGGEPVEKAPGSTADAIEGEAKSTVNELKEGWNDATKSGENKKLLAGLLAIFVGYLGVHKFILGYNKEGFILLGGFLIGVLTYCFLIGIFIIMAVGIVSLIEGILYLTKSDEEFYQTYQVNKKPWF